ncbi:MAG: hypothetical protein U0T69_11155 [Chitinophagales bacterium]
MDPIDERIFLVLNKYIEKHGLAYVARQIDILPNNVNRIKDGSGKFTRHQIMKIAELTNCNLNFIYGFESNIFRTEQKATKIHKKLEDILLELKKLNV